VLRNTTKFFLAAVLWMGAACEEAPAQEAMGRTLDSMLMPYPFILKSLNVIGNDSASAALGDFYQKLYELQTGKRDRVTVVHIGDSHIQADNFSGRVRQNLQLQFGNAGRGTVFPYRVAKTNGPGDYRSWTNSTNWSAKRSVFLDQPLPIGLAGFTIETLDTNALLRITMKSLPHLDYSFTKMSLFHEKGLEAFDVIVCDTLNCELSRIQANKTDAQVSVVNFAKPMNSVMLDFAAPDSNARRQRIYGMMLENGQPGVLYNMIGVNGAEYRHYNRSEYFMAHFAHLKPDLVIISLGTNEGYDARFKADVFQNNIDSLVTAIKCAAPEAKLLLTTPGDSFRRSRKGRVKNPEMKEARNTVIEYSTKHGVAYWDLFSIMGGYGSMAKWYVSGLAQKDRLHFSPKGYDLQGRMLYDALMKSYEAYVLNRYGTKKDGQK